MKKYERSANPLLLHRHSTHQARNAGSQHKIPASPDAQSDRSLANVDERFTVAVQCAIGKTQYPGDKGQIALHDIDEIIRRTIRIFRYSNSSDCYMRQHL